MVDDRKVAPWESNPGPTPIWGGPATILASVGNFQKIGMYSQGRFHWTGGGNRAEQGKHPWSEELRNGALILKPGRKTLEIKIPDSQGMSRLKVSGKYLPKNFNSFVKMFRHFFTDSFWLV